MAAAAAGGVLAIYLLIVRTPPGRWLDVQLYEEATGTPSWFGTGLARLARDVLPVPLLVLAVLAGLWTVLRGDWRRALLLVAAIPVATLLALVLRRHIFRATSFVWVGPDSYPSTHAALVAAAGFVICLLVVPGAARRWVLAVLLSVVVLGNVTRAAHMPSDAVGGVLVALTVVALAQLAVDRLAAR